MGQGPYDIEAPRNVQHFVDGVFVDSLDGATFESVSPIDNAVSRTWPRATADADRALAAARRAFDDGPVAADERRRSGAALLHRFADAGRARRRGAGAAGHARHGQADLREPRTRTCRAWRATCASSPTTRR